jgi:hypothetical protein
VWLEGVVDSESCLIAIADVGHQFAKLLQQPFGDGDNVVVTKQQDAVCHVSSNRVGSEKRGGFLVGSYGSGNECPDPIVGREELMIGLLTISEMLLTVLLA